MVEARDRKAKVVPNFLAWWAPGPPCWWKAAWFCERLGARPALTGQVSSRGCKDRWGRAGRAPAAVGFSAVSSGCRRDSEQRGQQQDQVTGWSGGRDGHPARPVVAPSALTPG